MNRLRPTSPPTYLDRIISWIDPIRGAKRAMAREVLNYAGSYSGASTTRRALRDWRTSPGDPDADILYDLPKLRERSRDLCRNNPIAVGALGTSCSSVVGTGLELQCRIDRALLGMADDMADAWEAATEREFRLWAESQDCDLARTINFYGLQELVFRQTLENGDAFTLMPRIQRAANPYMLALQIVEADRICNPGGVPDTDTLVAGVQKDTNGAPTAYHVANFHPGSMRYLVKDRTWTIVPAFGAQTGMRNVIHSFRMLRPGQTRGVPFLAPVIEALKQLDRYTEAELMAAVVSGMFTVFIKSEGDADLNTMVSDTGAVSTTAEGEYKLGNGAIIGLAPGEDISSANPGRPNQAFDPFIQAILRQVGAALEIPFEVLIRHFSSSYSASRAALLEAWRFFRGRRTWLADAWCQMVYEAWLAEAVALGRVPAPGFFADPLLRYAYSGTRWVGDAPGQIDPLKEVFAAEKRVALGVTTLDEETVILSGSDFETNYPRIAKERRLLTEIGMWQPVGAQSAPSGPAPQKEEDQDDAEEE